MLDNENGPLQGMHSRLNGFRSGLFAGRSIALCWSDSYLHSTMHCFLAPVHHPPNPGSLPPDLHAPQLRETAPIGLRTSSTTSAFLLNHGLMTTAPSQS
jgi:hypothetical protein